MNEHLIKELRHELDKLVAQASSIRTAINALEQIGHRKYQRHVHHKRKNRLTPEGRKTLSLMMKKRWAERKKAMAKR